MNVIFLDIDGVIQAYNSKKRFEVDTKELRDKISKDLNMDYSIYHSFYVSACYVATENSKNGCPCCYSFIYKFTFIYYFILQFI